MRHLPRFEFWMVIAQACAWWVLFLAVMFFLNWDRIF